MEPDSPSSRYARCVDFLFAGLDDSASDRRASPRPVTSLPKDWPSKPPPLETPEDLRAASA
jgi:hypothetical protein